MKTQMRYQAWLTHPQMDEELRRELEEIAGRQGEIEERFYKELEFGTAGLRGIIGAGTNRVNKYTIRKATQGLADYIVRSGKRAQGVVIAHDSRHKSREFAIETAQCLAANGVKAYLFEDLRPTPELSFAVRYFKAAAGVNITASHNPPEYNGYKVYWEDGAQITPPHSTGIAKCVEAVRDELAIEIMDLAEAEARGLCVFAGGEVDKAYLEEIKKMSIHPECIQSVSDELKVVYTPLHGAGNVPVQTVLKELGYRHIYVVKEQEKPDGAFPTVAYPNPEEEQAFVLAKKLACKVGADLILATDPDADRLGVCVRDRKTNEFKALTGNMTGCLLADYILGEKLKESGLPEDGFVVKSIVTTNMLNAVAETYGVELREVLTGFKYIGQQIRKSEQEGIGTYLFGMEESYGCLPGTYARDKDAVVAAMLLCEMAAYWKKQGKTLWDAMLKLYEKYGCFADEVESVTMKGMDGLARIAGIMEQLRIKPPVKLGDCEVLAMRDYDAGEILDMRTGKKRSTGLPKANVLYYELEREAWVCVRPSGTEPKIKIYYGVKADSPTMADTVIKGLKTDMKTRLEP